MGKQWKQWQSLFSWAPTLLWTVTAAMKLKDACSKKESYDKVKKQRHYFANKGLSSQSYGFSSSHVWMWDLDYKESWARKNWCYWTVVLEKTLESPLDCKEIQPVHPKGNQFWIFIGRIDLKLKLQYSGHLMWETDSLEKTLMLEGIRRRRQEDKGTTEDEMVGWHHWLNGHEFEQPLGVGDGQGSLLQSMGLQNGQTWLSDWTELKFWALLLLCFSLWMLI